MQYQLEEYEDQQPVQSEEQFVDEYGNEYDDGGYGYADEYQQQPEQYSEQPASDQYGEAQYDGQYDEYQQADEEQWTDEQQHVPHQDEQLMYEQDEAAGQHEEQVGQDEAGLPVTEHTELATLHSLPSHSHPLHPVQESENEPTSPEMSASALPSDVTLSSKLAALSVDRSQQPSSPPSAASSLQSPNTPQWMPLSPSSASRQWYVECVDLLLLYCRQSTSSDEVYQSALRLVDGLRYRYTAFAASPTATSMSAPAPLSGTDLAAALLRFMQSSLAPVQLQPLLQHAGRQVVEHLSLALSSVGCVALSSPSSHLSLTSSLLQSRIDALRIALRSRSSALPLLYVSPHHAADIEQLSLALSLPASSFFVVPTLPHPHSPSAVSSIYTMDAAHLHALLSRHAREKRHSAVLLLTIGSLCSLQPASSGYQLDDVQQLTDIAHEFGLWVHAEGSQIIESGHQQSQYEQQQQQREEGDRDGQADENATTASSAPDNRTWKERYTELCSSSAGVQTFVPSRVHSLSLHANDYFTLPDALAFTILTPNAALGNSQASDAAILTRAAVSTSAASVLSLWSQLLAVSSRSFSALLALFPALLTLSHAKLDAAKTALQSVDAPLLLSPAEYAALPVPPFLFFSLSLLPPFNHSYFHLSASQANELLADNLLRRGDSDGELSAILCSSSLLPSSTLFSHTGFLYSSFTPCPAPVDSVERHTAAFHHFLDCLQAELAIIAACGALMPALHSLLSNESDFELVPPSSLSHSTRPGLCVFRFTPSSIPTSFHNELTKSLLADLTAVFPAVFRGGECDAGSGGGGSAVIVLEVCEVVVERGVQSLVRAVHKLSRRVRLPLHVERELSAELKRSISATEAKLKASQAGSGGVIRSIPIVGSFFSYFAGGASKKGHSYDINTSYAANSAHTAQQQHTADRAKAESRDGTGSLPVKPSSGSGGDEQPAHMKVHPSLTLPTLAVQQQEMAAVIARSPVLSAASSEQDGMFSRGSSAVPPEDSSDRPQQRPRNEASLEQHYADEALSQSGLHSVPPVGEQHLFDQLSSRNPADLLSYIVHGTVLTIFFPSDPNQLDSPSSAIPLYLFYDSSSASLCWCEPGARYVVSEQTLPISAITELHLGNANPAFPADADGSRCFSIVAAVIQLHCEEEDAARRDEIVLALYSLLSDAQNEQNDTADIDGSNQPHTIADNDTRGTRTQNGGDSDPLNRTAAVAQSEHQHSRRTPQQSTDNQEETVESVPSAVGETAATGGRSRPTATAHSKQPAAALSASVPTSSTGGAVTEMSLSRALEVLEAGSDFTVFLVDRSNPQLTSRHPVVLWWIPDSAAGKGRLCWSRRSVTAPGRLEYHPSRSLLLSSNVELSLGKQTKALCNGGMEDVEAGRCVSVMVDRTVLNLAADSRAARDEWLTALHTVMANGHQQLTTASGR